MHLDCLQIKNKGVHKGYKVESTLRKMSIFTFGMRSETSRYTLSRSGEIGRRTGFKIPRRNLCGFESHLRHQFPFGSPPKTGARAVARKHGWRIQSTGAGAANMLNLSTQVPMKIFYLSDGPTKSMVLGIEPCISKTPRPITWPPANSVDWLSMH